VAAAVATFGGALKENVALRSNSGSYDGSSLKKTPTADAS